MPRPAKQILWKVAKVIISNEFDSLINIAKKSNGTVNIKTLIKYRNFIVKSL